jgi:trehalose utilization protein
MCDSLMVEDIHVTIWNEYRHEKKHKEVAEIYPQGIHGALAEALREAGLSYVHTVTLDDPEHGLSTEVLDATDVLVWWGHVAQREISDEEAERVRQRVLDGMGLIVLHSGHNAKFFKALMGTSCRHKWREANDHERIWVVAPDHPIAEGLDEYFEIDGEEMYGEYFDVPPPEALIFVSWFSGGEVFRSGCCYTRGRGKIFYFRPGHESWPTYHHAQVRRVIANAVRWAAPVHGPQLIFGRRDALEKQ